ncbi:MAG: hypothetical protein ACI915_004239 [Gammaproteobacteria bacterium]|jgi:hypothetical protein
MLNVELIVANRENQLGSLENTPRDTQFNGRARSLATRFLAKLPTDRTQVLREAAIP